MVCEGALLPAGKILVFPEVIADASVIPAAKCDVIAKELRAIVTDLSTPAIVGLACLHRTFAAGLAV